MRIHFHILKICLVILFFFFYSSLTSGQVFQVIKGKIINEETSSVVPFAHVTLISRGIGVVSNENGEFDLKIPTYNKLDSLLISCIGYKEYSISLSEVPKGKVLTIKLIPIFYDIAEAEIVGKETRISPKKIVKNAIAKIPENYPFRSYQMQGYYRDYLKFEDQYINLIEAGLIVEDPGFQVNDEESKVKIIQVRYSDSYKVDPALNLTYSKNQKDLYGFKFPAYGGNEFTILRAHNPIRNFRDFSFSFIDIFSRDFPRIHKFTLDSISYIGETPVYCIGFKYYYTDYKDPWLAIRIKYRIHGSIFIRRDNFGILKLIYSTSRSRNDAPLQKLYELVVEYSNFKDKMFLNYISFMNYFEVEKTERVGGFDIRPIYIPYYQFREFFVNQISLINFTPLIDSELFNPTEPFYNQKYTLDHWFWDEFNIVKLLDIEDRANQIDEPILTTYLTNKLYQYNSKFNWENIYIQLDKNIYQPRDTLWLKAYVLDYTSNQFAKLSNTLYASIYDDNGDRILNRKLLISENGTYGEFLLPDTLQEGFYNITAYSSWMKNFDPEYVFTKEFEVRKIFNQDLFVNILYDKSSYEPDDTIKAEIQVTTINNKPLGNIKYKYDVFYHSELLSESNGRTDDNGKDKIQFILPRYVNQSTIHLLLNRDGEEYEKFYIIPIGVRNVDLQFFPEGGDLVHGLECNIAFKAIDEFGKSFDFNGEILDSKFNQIKTIQTVYEGMGDFLLTPDLTQEYFVRIIEPRGYDKLYDIPKPKNNGLILNIDSIDETSIKIKVKSTQDEIDKHICVLLQMRGVKYYAVEGQIKDEVIINIPTKGIPAGVASITLFDNQKIPVAERLVFVNKNRKLNINVTTNKDLYLPREKVSTSIEVTDENGSPVPAFLSISITDVDLTYTSQIRSTNILSSILLESELKGQIPTPDFYFKDKNYLADKALDLVMMTNGWRRFSWSTVLNMNLDLIPDPVAIDMVSGTVFKRNGRPASHANLSVTQFNPPRITDLQANEEGRFQFNFQLMPDSLNKLGFIAKSQKGRNNVKIILDEPFDDKFSTNLDNYFKSFPISSIQYKFSNYGTTQFEQREYLLDFDETKFIPEVTVSTRRRLKNESVETYHARIYGDYKIGEELNPNMPIEFWILDIHPQALLINGNVMFRRSSFNFNGQAGFNYGPPLIVLDERYRGISFSNLRIFNNEQIESIGTLDGGDAFMMFGETALYGAIIVTTKKDYVQKVIRDKNVAFLNIYSPVKEFYTPIYETEEQKDNNLPDLRTTIHWIPNLYIDGSGVKELSFYNADRSCKIKGVIEGVGNNGMLGYKEFDYQVKKNY